MIKDFLKKWCCMHDWQEVRRVNVYVDDDDIPHHYNSLYICKKCGKMKKITLFLTLTLSLTSCNYHNGYSYSTDMTFSDAIQEQCELVTIEFNGEKHEYVFYRAFQEGSLSHWEGCKYCKKY